MMVKLIKQGKLNMIMHMNTKVFKHIINQFVNEIQFKKEKKVN